MTRQELVAAARTFQNGELPEHAQNCKECKEDLMMLVKFQVTGNLPLPEPPHEWVERATALAHESSLLQKAGEAVARLVFDSWTLPQPVGVRGGATTEHRRVRFECENVAVDLRAEQQTTGWSFVAQVIGVDPVSVSLNTDHQKVSPDAHGICQWSCKKPPKRMILEIGGATVRIPELTWKKKPAKK